MAIARASSAQLKQLLSDVRRSDLIETKIEEDEDGMRYRRAYSPLFPELKECACLNFLFYRNNESKWDRRAFEEAAIVDLAKTKFAAKRPTNSPIKYLSLGSGYLLQDFILCAALLLEGFSLHVKFIEPNCTAESFKAAYRHFTLLKIMAAEIGLAFETDYFKSMLDYLTEKPNETVDVGVAIDFDPYCCSERARVDTLLAHQLLSEDGFLFLSLGGITEAIARDGAAAIGIPPLVSRDSAIHSVGHFFLPKSRAIREAKEHIQVSTQLQNIMINIVLTFHVEDPNFEMKSAPVLMMGRTST